MLKHSIFAATFLLLTACSGSEGTSSGGLTEAECKRFFDNIYSFGDVRPEPELISMSVKACVENEMVSRKDYECGVKASSTEEVARCNITLDATH